MLTFKKNLAILYLQGGIGNLLFELSAALYYTNNNLNNIYAVELEKERINKIKKYLDINLYELSNFQKVLFGINVKINNFLLEVITRLLKKINLHFGKHIHGGHFENINFIKNNNNTQYVLTGYFQHPDYYSKSKDLISDLFLKKHKLNNKNLLNQIAIHLRRADYINHGWELSIKYYKDILSKLSKDKEFNQKKIKIFTDDPFSVFAIKDLALQYNFKVDENNNDNDLDDFIEVVCSSTVVMSNSSFCWWATTIGDRLLEDKVVFYPKGWIKGFNDCLKDKNWNIFNSYEK